MKLKSPVLFPTYEFVSYMVPANKSELFEWSWAKASEIAALIKRLHGKSWTPTEMAGRFGLTHDNAKLVKKTGGDGDARPLRIMVLEGGRPNFTYYHPSMLPALQEKEFYVPSGWAKKVIEHSLTWDMVIVSGDDKKGRRIGVAMAMETSTEGLEFVPIAIW